MLQTRLPAICDSSPFATSVLISSSTTGWMPCTQHSFSTLERARVECTTTAMFVASVDCCFVSLRRALATRTPQEHNVMIALQEMWSGLEQDAFCDEVSKSATSELATNWAELLFPLLCKPKAARIVIPFVY